jgi:hypothetical protein
VKAIFTVGLAPRTDVLGGRTCSAVLRWAVVNDLTTKEQRAVRTALRAVRTALRVVRTALRFLRLLARVCSHCGHPPDDFADEETMVTG